jgi:hypothetical protein
MLAWWSFGVAAVVAYFLTVYWWNAYRWYSP